MGRVQRSYGPRTLCFYSAILPLIALIPCSMAFTPATRSPLQAPQAQPTLLQFAPLHLASSISVYNLCRIKAFVAELPARLMKKHDLELSQLGVTLIGGMSALLRDEMEKES